MATVPIELRLPANPRAARLARQALDPLTTELRADQVDNVRLLVSELVTNSVRHAGLPTDGAVTLKVSLTGRTIRVEVYDAGEGFTPAAPPRPREDSGWGLYLVERIANRWGVRGNDTTCVWFEIDRDRPG